MKNKNSYSNKKSFFEGWYFKQQFGDDSQQQIQQYYQQNYNNQYNYNPNTISTQYVQPPTVVEPQADNRDTTQRKKKNPGCCSVICFGPRIACKKSCTCCYKCCCKCCEDDNDNLGDIPNDN